MGHRIEWWLCLAIFLCPSTFPMACRWLQLHQERLSRMILLSFKDLEQGEPFPLQCIVSELFPPNINSIYDATKVQTAMLTLQEVMLQINKYYDKTYYLSGYNRTKMAVFQTLLQYQTGYLIDCNSNSKTNLEWQVKKPIKEYFKKLEEIANEKDHNLCAQPILRIEVQKQLQLSIKLTTQIRRLNHRAFTIT